jgi:hypothetical protein
VIIVTPARTLEILQHVEEHSRPPDGISPEEIEALDDMIEFDGSNVHGQPETWSLTTLGEMELEDLQSNT